MTSGTDRMEYIHSVVKSGRPSCFTPILSRREFSWSKASTPLVLISFWAGSWSKETSHLQYVSVGRVIVRDYLFFLTHVYLASAWRAKTAREFFSL